MFIISLIIILIVAIVIYNKEKSDEFDFFLLKMDKVEKDIKELLKKRKNLLTSICANVNLVNKKKIFKKLDRIKQETDSIALDRELNTLNYDLKEYLILHRNFVFSDEIDEKTKEVKIVEINLDAAKNFYNNNLQKYNDMIDRFPTKSIAKRKGIDFKAAYEIENTHILDSIENNQTN